MPRPIALAIAGPTASGKSALAMALAERFAVEIISVDSALVYRGMDIGTAKPTLAERTRVKHHLIDIVEPTQSWSAAAFAQSASQLITEIRSRGHLPLLVGGTMLYFKALMQGIDDLPGADPAIRQQLDHDAERLGWPALHRRLMDVDPTTAQRLAPGDRQRIQRALEVWMLTGQPISDFHRTAATTKGEKLVHQIPVFSLEPTDRSWLHQRIATRFDAMLAEGFMDEMNALRARGDLQPHLPSMRCVGYRQAWQAMDENWSTEQLHDRAVIATRQLAKRQLTWLRAMATRHVLPITSTTSIGFLIDQITAHITARQA